MYVHKRNLGFTLVEMLLLLAVSLGIMTIKSKDIQKDLDVNHSKIAGEQIKAISNAANNYISVRYGELSQSISASSGAGSPRTCVGDLCSITVQTLINDGFLPSNFKGKNVIGSDYSIQIKRSGAAPNYTLNGLVITNTPWKDGNKIRYDMLGNAIKHAGADSGFTRNTTSVSGYAGSWSKTQSEYPAINKAGQLAQRIGYDSGMYTVYLRRDGALPMTGDLNLGNNDISNITSITTNGTVSAGTINSSGAVNSTGVINARELRAKSGYGDLISIGGDASGNDYEIKLGSAKPLSFFSPSISDYTTVLQVLNGNLKVNQRLGLMGVDPNTVPAGWSGGLSTRDLYATGTIGAGNGSSLAAYMNSAGNIYASNNATTNTMNTNYLKSNGNLDVAGGFTSNTTVSNYIRSNGNIDVAGALYSWQSTSHGRTSVGEYLYIGGIAALNTGCYPNGLMGREPNGQFLFCRNGVWSKFQTGKVVNVCPDIQYGGCAGGGCGNTPADLGNCKGQLTTALTWCKDYKGRINTCPRARIEGLQE